jgi:prepilin-type N-terminal cleavage/methylation domain-containing protein
MNEKREEAFTLIEVIVVIAVLAIVLGALSNILINGWRFWDFNQKSVDLSQATTLISANLDRNIRSSSDYDLSNPNELLLYTGSGGDTSKDNFFKYSFENNRIVLYKPSSDPADPELSSVGSWVLSRNITDPIVTDANFNFIDPVIKYSITLENERKSITIDNVIKPRPK